MKAAQIKPGGRILVIGCGLIGTSFAKAIRTESRDIVIHGVDPNTSYREWLSEHTVFDALYDSLQPLLDFEPGRIGESDSGLSASSDTTCDRGSIAGSDNGWDSGSSSFPYDLALLATPISTACDLLPDAAKLAKTITDVCSIKEPICQAALEHQLGNRFTPSHPMAGLATGGPQFADEHLFRNQPWILIDGWPASTRALPWIERCGARVTYLRSPKLHDHVMAGVSHGVHLMSLSTMLAAHSTCGEEAFSQVTGPGFRDVTRLAASPEGFWVDTLIRNREPVVEYLRHAISFLSDFAASLEGEDADALATLLRAARDVKAEWSSNT